MRHTSMKRTQVRVRVTPRAGRSEIVRREGDVIYARVSAPPVNGAANSALIELLADVLGIRKSAVSIESGSASRDKRVSVEDMEIQEILSRLDARTGPGTGRRKPPC